MAADATVALDPNTTYVVQLWPSGSNRTARLVDAGASEALSTPVASAGLYTSGVTGIVLQTAYDAFDQPVGPIVGAFDQARSLTKPGSGGALLTGIASLGVIARRQKGRSHIVQGARGAA